MIFDTGYWSSVSNIEYPASSIQHRVSSIKNMSDSTNRKSREGTVISNKMDKTATVLIERLVEHPVYHRVVRKSKKVLVHDENNDCQVGDKVRIVETRPLSKRKRWRVVK